QAVGLALNMREHNTLILSAQATDNPGDKIKGEFRALSQLLVNAGATVDIDGEVKQPPPPPVVGKRPPPAPPPAPKFTLRSQVQDKVPTFTLEVQLPPPDGNALLLRNVLRPQAVMLRGLMEMADGKSHLFELAAAVQSYLKENNAFPRGTFDR